MNTKFKFKLKFTAFPIIALVSLTFGQNVSAHTGPEISQINENTRTSNNIVIGHGCGDNSVIGTSVVFPDGVDSTITVDGQPHTGSLLDFVQNWTNANQKIYDRGLFTYQDEKTDSNSNVVGFWAGGESLPHNLIGFVPFRTSAVLIEPTSCAKSVKFHISIADICEITDVAGFNETTVNFWTLSTLETPYDADTDATSSLTINRTSALPSSCGTGVAVEVKPSAAQINRDMPIKMNGSQVWPK